MCFASPLVSIIILSWNRREELRTTLQAVSQQGYRPCETIVVDNGSTDGSPQMVQALFPDARVIALPRNVGIDGLNVGFRAAKGELSVLLDDDSYPLSEAISRLVAAFQQDPHLGIAACRVIDLAGRSTERWPQAAEGGREVPTFVGCGVAIRRTAVEQAGFFDGAFFLYGNELDLTARIVEAGYTVRYFPEIMFAHAVSPINRTNLRADYYCVRNMLWIVWKYFPAPLALLLSLRVIVESIGYRLVHGDMRRIWAVLRGVWGALTGRHAPLGRCVLSSETRRLLLTFIDRWYPPAWAWLRTRLQWRV